MRLYIGGKAQGKTEYVRKLYQEALICDENNFQSVLGDMIESTGGDKNCCDLIIWNHFHLCIMKLITEGIDDINICNYVNHITRTIKNIIIISDEIGNGIVPMDAVMRDYREIVGRLLIDIAKESESVERIICQIPMKLK